MTADYDIINYLPTKLLNSRISYKILYNEKFT